MNIKTGTCIKEVSFEITENNALNLLSETDFNTSTDY